MTMASILIVEDEAIVALDLKLQLRELGYQVVGIAANAADAIGAAERLQPDLILMDVRLQGPVDGITAAMRLRERQDIPIIFLTSHSDGETVSRAALAAPYGYLTKPYQIRELRAGIEVALTKARMERQLRESDRWFANTLRCVGEAVVTTDPAGLVRFLNPAAEQLTGWPLADALGKPVQDVVRLLRATAIVDEASANLAQAIDQVIRDGRPRPMVYGLRLLTPGGRETLVDQALGPVDDASGRRVGAVLVLRDATERLAGDAVLRASEAQFRDAFDSAPLGMALVALDGQLLQVNEALCRLVDQPREALLFARNDDLTVDGDRDHEAARLRELSTSALPLVQFEKRYRRPSGDLVTVLVSASLLNGRPAAEAGSCYLYQIHDLSEQKRAAEQMATMAAERLQHDANELARSQKTEFLSRASHELRTPLNAVIGFSQLLKTRGLALDRERVDEYADHIHVAGAHLLSLVNDLMDIRDSANGALSLQPEPIALDRAIADATEALRPAARVREIRLRFDALRPLTVSADPKRLQQVLTKLTSNAVKYGRQGGSVRFASEAVSPDRIALTVTDDGIGMTPDQLARLFQPFDRLGAEKTAIPGTGLGLVIARSLVAEMGGTLAVHSSAGVGTTVTIELPAAVG